MNNKLNLLTRTQSLIRIIALCHRASLLSKTVKKHFSEPHIAFNTINMSTADYSSVPHITTRCCKLLTSASHVYLFLAENNPMKCTVFSCLSSPAKKYNLLFSKLLNLYSHASNVALVCLVEISLLLL